MRTDRVKPSLGSAVTREIVVGDPEHPDDCLRATIRVLGFGERLQSAMQEAQEIEAEGDAEGAVEALLRCLADVVSTWNLRDDAGRSVPPLLEAMRGKVDAESAAVLVVAIGQGVAGAPFAPASSES